MLEEHRNEGLIPNQAVLRGENVKARARPGLPVHESASLSTLKVLGLEALNTRTTLNCDVLAFLKAREEINFTLVCSIFLGGYVFRRTEI